MGPELLPGRGDNAGRKSGEWRTRALARFRLQTDNIPVRSLGCKHLQPPSTQVAVRLTEVCLGRYYFALEKSPKLETS
jgi:hypothetical protein